MIECDDFGVIIGAVMVCPAYVNRDKLFLYVMDMLIRDKLVFNFQMSLTPVSCVVVITDLVLRPYRCSKPLFP